MSSVFTLTLTFFDISGVSDAGGFSRRGAARAELVSWAFSVRLEHLFPLFMPDEIFAVQSLMDTFKTARFYPAASPATVGWHELMRNVPSEFSLEHRSQLLRMFVQFCIYQGDRGLIGHGQGQICMMSRKVIRLNMRNAHAANHAVFYRYRNPHPRPHPI